MQLVMGRVAMGGLQLQAHKDGVVHLHLDSAHMGVGGDDSWSPTVHEEVLGPPAKYELEVSLCRVPLVAGDS